MRQPPVLPLVSLSYVGEISIIGHFNETVSSSTIGQFIIRS